MSDQSGSAAGLPGPAAGPADPSSATDPVCGMAVAPAVARQRNLASRYRDRDWFFCGRGCKLDFDEDPERYLDPGYVPTM